MHETRESTKLIATILLKYAARKFEHYPKFLADLISNNYPKFSHESNLFATKYKYLLLIINIAYQTFVINPSMAT